MAAVTVLVYDLSRGLARALSPALLAGRVIEGVWHTSIVVHGREHYFGQGICAELPRTTPFGLPLRELNMGTTHLDASSWSDFLAGVGARFSATTYDFLQHNCNHFVNEALNMLTGASLPDEYLRQGELVHSVPALAALFSAAGGGAAPLQGVVVAPPPTVAVTPPPPPQPSVEVHDDDAFAAAVRAEFERLMAADSRLDAELAAEQAVSAVLLRHA